MKSLEMKNFETKCVQAQDRQIVTKWLYSPRKHSTISSKYAACLYLYSKQSCFP